MPTPSSDVQRDPRTGAPVGRPVAAAGPVDDADTMRFRAATLEAAIELAERSLGSRVRVVAANRIRRGGIGGFFASDLGVEVTVALDDETMEDALARLVAESEADERARWTTRSTAAAPTAVEPAPTGTTGPAPQDGDIAGARSLLESFAEIAARAGAIADAQPPAAPAPTATPARPASSPDIAGPTGAAAADTAEHVVNPVLAEVLAAIMAEAAQARELELAGADDSDRADHNAREVYVVDPYERNHRAFGGITGTAPLPTEPAAPVAPVAPVAQVADDRPARLLPSATMVRVEQIIEELSAITAAPVFGDERVRPRAARPRLADLGGHTTSRRDDPDARTTTAPLTAPRLPDAPTLPAATPARPKILPTLPPRPSEIARAAAAASAASHARLLHSPSSGPVGPTDPVEVDAVEVDAVEVDAVEVDAVDVETPVIEHTDPTAAATADGALEPIVARLPERPASIRRLHVPVRHTGPDASVSPSLPATVSASAPSRRQVELAVAAADQLIESLSREDGVKRLSVRVVLRTGDQREVEAEAEWEAD